MISNQAILLASRLFYCIRRSQLYVVLRTPYRVRPAELDHVIWASVSPSPIHFRPISVVAVWQCERDAFSQDITALPAGAFATSACRSPIPYRAKKSHPGH